MNPTQIYILPFTLYLVVNGALYFYKGFNDVNQPKLLVLEKHADFVCDDKGRIIKNRGNINLKIVTETIQDLLLGKDAFQMVVREVTDETIVNLCEKTLVKERIELFQTLELYKNA